MEKNIKCPPQGNKWGAEDVVEILMDIERDALEMDILFLGKALTRRGLYPQLWSYWKHIFRDNEDIMSRMMRITCIFEGKIYEGALRKELSTWMALSALKRNYHWNEAPEPEDKGGNESGVFIRLNNDTLIVASDPEFSGTYVKVKKEDKKVLPDGDISLPINTQSEEGSKNSYTS